MLYDGMGLLYDLDKQLKEDNGTPEERIRIIKEISEYDKLDKTLSAKALKDIGTKFAGPLGSAHPFVSPIYGNLENLGSFFVFYSDSELMFPDVQKFIGFIEKANGSSIQSYVEKNAPHDYLMSSTKEKNAEYYSLIQEFITK